MIDLPVTLDRDVVLTLRRLVGGLDTRRIVLEAIARRVGLDGAARQRAVDRLDALLNDEIKPEPARDAAGLFLYPPPDKARGCQAGRDGECNWSHCPQIRDNEPHATGRHCPRDKREEDDD